MAAVNDDIVDVSLGPRRLFLMNGPGPARALLSHTGGGLRKERALRLARIIFGRGLLTSEGELHRRQRRLIQPAFETRQMPGYAEAFSARARALRDR
ncbi:MAG: cytochrome P450, partial [Gammaproteobacteria bacterium]|nr:cytochrome P450 [Gemmatimonadota bacterium]NIU79915.1 cytochrome P450 [Gammaproteobacteria bacterium]